MIKEQIIEDEENETKLFDPSPICSIEVNIYIHKLYR